MRYRLQRHDGTDCSATMVPFTVLRMVPIQRYRQVKAHIRVTVAVLDAHNSVANHCHARPVTEKFLECRLGVELFRLDELVIKVEVVQPAFLELPGCHQAIEHQLIEPFDRIESIFFAGIRSVGYVALSELAYRP